VDLSASPPRLLRPGLVSPTEIEAVIGPVRLTTAPEAEGGQPLPSPGMLRRHYAPRAPLECVVADGPERVEELVRQGMRVGWVTFAGASRVAPAGALVVVMPRDPAVYASGLYAALHDLDASGVDRIVVAMPPDTAEWLAVRDRLRRASADS
jgi:L-threonylcarbamoyladenylate synthase